MSYKLEYAYVSHTGRIRKVNQDNFICNHEFMHYDNNGTGEVYQGSIRISRDILMGVFDGVGGEEHGEIAAYLASAEASEFKFGKDLESGIRRFYESANNRICQYASNNSITAMGATAAMLMFTPKYVWVTNIGDSKIYRLYDGKFLQLSKDHVVPLNNGRKPALSQSLGIPETEMKITPYLISERIQDKAIYLICSDGLTDMVGEDEIAKTLGSSPLADACSSLLNAALENGGKDNTTIVLCQTIRKPFLFW